MGRFSITFSWPGGRTWGSLANFLGRYLACTEFVQSLIRVGDRVAYVVQCKQVLPHDAVGRAVKAIGRCAHT